VLLVNSYRSTQRILLVEVMTADSAKKRVPNLYREFQRVLVKWGNHPAILQQFGKMVADREAELGDVQRYTWGRGSSKPTPQASRSSHKRKK
jgi:hypothetical protein